MMHCRKIDPPYKHQSHEADKRPCLCSSLYGSQDLATRWMKYDDPTLNSSGVYCSVFALILMLIKAVQRQRGIALMCGGIICVWWGNFTPLRYPNTKMTQFRPVMPICLGQGGWSGLCWGVRHCFLFSRFPNTNWCSFASRGMESALQECWIFLPNWNLGGVVLCCLCSAVSPSFQFCDKGRSPQSALPRGSRRS